MYTPTNPREHTSLLIILGRLFPISKAQAKKVIKTGYIDMLDDKDKEKIDTFMKANGETATFKKTKSGSFYRLTNFDAFARALKRHFEI